MVKVSNVVKKVTRNTKEVLKRKQWKEKRIKDKVEAAGHGVVYITHIPHGFYEKELHGYFKQFGRITAIKLPRNKNGKSKGFAFVEFKVKEVAKIAAESMNNYMICGRLIKTEYIPPDKQQPHLFSRTKMPWNDSSFNDVTEERRKANKFSHNNPKVIGSQFVGKANSKVTKMKELLTKSGYNYKFQVNDPNNENVQLINAKSSTSDSPSSPVRSKSTRLQQRLPVLEIDESDTEIKFKPPPNVVTKLIRSSKSKLKTIKSNADVVKEKLVRETKSNKTVKGLKTKINKVKDKVTKRSANINGLKRKTVSGMKSTVMKKKLKEGVKKRK